MHYCQLISLGKIKFFRFQTFQKLSHLGVGVRNFLLERGDKRERGGGAGAGDSYRDRGLTLLYYFTVQSHLLCVGGE